MDGRTDAGQKVITIAHPEHSLIELKMWWSNKCLGGSVLILKNISVPWFGRDYWHGGRADNSIKQPITPSTPIARGWITRLLRQPIKFAIATILNFVSTSNFISIHSPSTYKLSMIPFVHNWRQCLWTIEILLTRTLYRNSCFGFRSQAWFEIKFS